jgi:hypothetical protein
VARRSTNPKSQISSRSGWIQRSFPSGAASVSVGPTSLASALPDYYGKMISCRSLLHVTTCVCNLAEHRSRADRTIRKTTPSKKTVFWIVTPYRSEKSRRFGETFARLRDQSVGQPRIQKKHVEIRASFVRNTRRHNLHGTMRTSN